MKNVKNICLLIGIVLNFVAIIMRGIYFYSVYIAREIPNALIMAISIIAIFLLLTVIPIVLLVRNLRNKTGKILPIICVAVNGASVLYTLYALFKVNIPQYLITSELALISIYATMIKNFVINGGILFLIGYILLIIGSALSLPKNKGR